MTIETITTEQLAALTWEVADIDVGDHELIETDPEPVGVDEDGEWELEPRFVSYVNGLCLLRCVEHPEITYSIDWTAQGGQRSMTDAYEFNVTVNDAGENLLDVGSIEIVDIEGDTLTPSKAVYEVGHDIEQSIDWESEVQKHLPELGTEDIDIDEDSDMDTIELKRDNGPDVRFTGEKIASASSHHYEGPRNIRWTELVLYRTAGGKLVCHEVGRTCWQGEHDRFSVHVSDTAAELVESVGYGRLAKDLYDEAGIDHAQEIE